MGAYFPHFSIGQLAPENLTFRESKHPHFEHTLRVLCSQTSQIAARSFSTSSGTISGKILIILFIWVINTRHGDLVWTFYH